MSIARLAEKDDELTAGGDDSRRRQPVDRRAARNSRWAPVLARRLALWRLLGARSAAACYRQRSRRSPSSSSRAPATTRTVVARMSATSLSIREPRASSRRSRSTAWILSMTDRRRHVTIDVPLGAAAFATAVTSAGEDDGRDAAARQDGAAGLIVQRLRNLQLRELRAQRLLPHRAEPHDQAWCRHPVAPR